MVYTHTHTHTHTHTNRIPLKYKKKNEILLFATTWIDLEGIILSEISQRKTNTICYHFYVESKNESKLVNITQEIQTHRYREQASGYQWGEGKDEGQDGVGD